LVTLQELAVEPVQDAALVAVLERRGLLTHTEVLHEINRFNETAGRPR
jgi:hypothetical protein